MGIPVCANQHILSPSSGLKMKNTFILSTVRISNLTHRHPCSFALLVNPTWSPLAVFINMELKVVLSVIFLLICFIRVFTTYLRVTI
jgi:hypothetical protein